MITLPSELEKKMESLEKSSKNPQQARAYLESAVIFQYRVVADRLFATLLLQDESLDEEIWWQHYLTTYSSPPYFFPDLGDPDFLIFRQRFLQDFAARKIPPLKRKDLTCLDIKIYHGIAKIWQDTLINRQLKKLGSSLRVCIVNRSSYRLSHLQASLASDRVSKVPDGRFLVGYIDCTSAFVRFDLFNFVNDAVVSPYLPLLVNGFPDIDEYENDRIVVRQLPEKIKQEKYCQDNNIDREFPIDMWPTIIHELTHLDSRRSKRPPNLRKWYEEIRYDICRYTQKARSKQEIVTKFKVVFRFLPGRKYSIDDLITDLINEKAITIQPDRSLYCSLYEKGKTWQV